VPEGARVLDVGSGLAQFTRAIARAAGPSGYVLGIERDDAQRAEALRQARHDGEEHLVDLRQGEAYTLPLSEEEWSTFDNQFISITDVGEAAIPRNWDDVYHASLGFRYRKNERWRYKFGYSYDTSPTTAADRTADMPMDRQWRIAAGADWNKSEKLDIGFEFTYVDFGSGRIDSDTLVGDFSTNRAVMLGVNFNWKRGA